MEDIKELERMIREDYNYEKILKKSEELDNYINRKIEEAI